MVTPNRLLHGKWTVKRFNATVIKDIWPEVFFFTLIATMVTFVTMNTAHSLAVSPQLLTLLGIVLGLVISFRTSTAYERYQDGRRMWVNINNASRNLAQLIWIHVPNERPGNDDGQGKQSVLESVIEKKTMVNLVQAYSVAVKHYLRGEEGVYYEDLYPLLAVLPRYAGHSKNLLPLWQASEDGQHPYDHDLRPAERSARQRETTYEFEIETDKISSPSPSWFGSQYQSLNRSTTFDPEKALPNIRAHRPLRRARNPPRTTVYDYLPFLRVVPWLRRRLARSHGSDLSRAKTKRDKLGYRLPARSVTAASNVPLELTTYLSAYAAYLMRINMLQPSVATGLVTNIALLQDTMNNLDRIANTPIPFAYQAHLYMSLWIYLLLLPFQAVDSFGYLTIPATAFASFLLFGFLVIGQEIENPFDYGNNDLDIDDFCLTIQRELQEITAHPSPDPSLWMFSHWNQPFAPADRRTAAEMVRGETEYGMGELEEDGDGQDRKGKGMDGLRETLLKSWRITDDMTREKC